MIGCRVECQWPRKCTSAIEICSLVFSSCAAPRSFGFGGTIRPSVRLESLIKSTPPGCALPLFFFFFFPLFLFSYVKREIALSNLFLGFTRGYRMCRTAVRIFRERELNVSLCLSRVTFWLRITGEEGGGDGEKFGNQYSQARRSVAAWRWNYEDRNFSMCRISLAEDRKFAANRMTIIAVVRRS